MNRDEIIYLALLILSIPVGHFIKCTVGFRKKQYVCSAIGFFMIALTCGVHGLHSLITTTVNCVIICLLGPKFCHIASFIWCFSYLAFFRATQYFGLPQVPALSNAIQLVLTLKLIGLAFEVSDSHRNRQSLKESPDDEKIKLRNEFQNISPTLLDMFLYSYCYIGILTGPYYKYRTYQDMIYDTNVRHIDTFKPVFDKLKVIPIFGVGFLVASSFFSIKVVQLDEFYEEPFWFRLLYMVPMFYIFRMRFYVAWVLAECMCITAAMGAYPANSRPRTGHGPTDLKALKECQKQAPEGIAYDFETIHNIDYKTCEFAITVREGMRSWNMTVQYWMAFLIYKKLPFKLAPLKVAITMGVSAFWHGIHPGYYMSFLTVPMNLVAEDAMTSAFRDHASPRRQKVFDWFCWFWRTRSFDYMCMGFLLLTFTDTIRYWKSVYFIGHVFVFLCIILGNLCKPKYKKSVDITPDSHPSKDKKVQ